MPWESRPLTVSGMGVPSPVLIPADRLVNWKPGVTYNGGIPNRTTIFTTLTANGTDDTSQITTALTNASAVASAGSPQVVALNAGLYKITGSGIVWPVLQPGKGSYVTLRGLGSLPAAMATGGNLANDSASALNYVGGTWLIKADRNTDLNHGVLYLGFGPDRIFTALSSTNLTADGVKGSFSIQVTSAAAFSIGQICLLDSIGDADPTVEWGNRADLSGYFTGSLSATGNQLTFTAAINGPSGVDGSANATFSGTTMTINSSPSTGYWQQIAPFGDDTQSATVFDTSNNFLGYLISGAYPTFTLSQSNAGTKNINIGGVMPYVNAAIFDGVFSKFYGFVNSGTLPGPMTVDRAVPNVSSTTLCAGGGTRRFFGRQDRPLSQLVKITNISGTTITFETPLYYPFAMAYAAQLTAFDTTNYPTVTAASIENLGVFGGMGGDGQGNISVGICDSCWIKNVESYWAIGSSIGLYGSYRCEVRGCLIHETPNPNPGAGGYLSSLNQWASDCLFEDNIMWQGNKVNVMRTAGGGNVIAYNYMDDSLGGTYPQSPEAGVNAAHQTCTVMALLEGNYSHNFQGDSFWGNSAFITVHLNWLTGIRGCSPTGGAPNITPCNNLRAYTYVPGGTTYPYADVTARRMISVQCNSYNHNFTGNVLGFNGMTFLGAYSGVTSGQTTWVYENLDGPIDGELNVILWGFGSQQNPLFFSWIPTTYTTQLRKGNWDWMNQGGHTPGQRWYVIGGSDEYGGTLSPPYPSIPNSYYLPGGANASIPSFFSGSSYSTTTWPWVNPATGYTAGGAVTSGTYNSGSGLVTLTVPTGLAPAPGTSVFVTGLSGTGTNLASLNGLWTSGGGTGGTTVTYTAATGLGSITIAGGFINIVGGGLPAHRRFLNNTPNVL